MPRTPKTLADARTNLETALTYIPDRYRVGVQRGDWESGATSEAAEKNYAAAMSAVLAKKLRQAGCRGKQDVWRTGAVEKGAPVIADRIRMALGKYEANFGPVYNAVLSAVKTLPPRGIDPLANIDARLKPVVSAAVKAGKRGRRA
jgi:hypothetical protein